MVRENSIDREEEKERQECRSFDKEEEEREVCVIPFNRKKEIRGKAVQGGKEFDRKYLSSQVTLR
ncbi:hypothetical protein MA16_Dca003018 [Dendrobium catenatum]|uniref:Uncharacterized protein n=1 Tax=Dendrobium catenatum TaxID=906689 RepID=A0A2I0X9B7_9ASPA|nr:hypothetical protein MA16_Dca003018 [Dendrobium catenatum]